MRGEYKSFFNQIRLNLGSSPHARGILFPPLIFCPFCGFIPACAGNTSTLAALNFCNGVHPRMRGEYNRRLAFLTSTLGSSPHARGIHSHEEELRGAGRFIPACAGNTAGRSPGWCSIQVHPRMRGEYRSS